MTVGATPPLPYHIDAPSFTLERSAAGGGETSLENSRRMKKNSHRAVRRCYESGVETLQYTVARRLDGYTLYNADPLQTRPEKEARRRPLRPSVRQLRWRGDPAQRDRYLPRADQAAGRPLRGRPPAGQGPASGARVAPATGLRDRLRLRRLQRRRAAGRRRDPQAAPRPRSPGRPAPGLAADALAVRERRRGAGAAPDGARGGRDGDRAPAAPAPRPGHAHHDRPGSHRRSDPRPGGVHLLQRPLRHVVLSAAGGQARVS